MNRLLKTMAAILLTTLPASPMKAQSTHIPDVKWDRHSLIIDGKRVMPVMGEIHYSRLPADEWREELTKMKEGGVTIIANYVFWNHVEETEGIFNWSGQRNLRAFLEICQELQLPVVLRIGPFCHGEVRCGGIPDWVFAKGCKTRDTNPVFMNYTRILYRQIFAQIQGLQWKDGGPVMAVQFDNEQRNGNYLMALKKEALAIGFDLPFYTRTGWPALTKPVPYGEMLPLFGDYADGFWERSIEETAGKYYQAFNFRSQEGTPSANKKEKKTTNGQQSDFDVTSQISQDEAEAYPYFTCELGGGMMTAYHRRPYIYPEDAYSLAICKLGSGSNLLGYYMYHGGTNPDGITYLNECQQTLATNYNDMPVKTYDFQAPLGEFGQKNPHYEMLRKLHLMMRCWGDVLAPMEPVFSCPQDLKKGEDNALRWAYRQKGEQAFVFVNNYERLQQLSDKKNVRFSVCGVDFPRKPITIPANTSCIFPVNIDGIRYATAQLVEKRDGKIIMQQVAGIPVEIAIDGKVLRNVKPKGMEQPVYKNIYLLPDEKSLHQPTAEPMVQQVSFTKKQEAASQQRAIPIGVQKVAEAPSDQDFDKAAIYQIALDGIPTGCKEQKQLLEINYCGDVARLYADGKLVADNFYNGRPFLMGLWRLPQGCKTLELRILPLQKEMPVYFPREADTTPGEIVSSVILKQM